MFKETANNTLDYRQILFTKEISDKKVAPKPKRVGFMPIMRAINTTHNSIHASWHSIVDNGEGIDQ
jgi:hypothetical protein